MNRILSTLLILLPVIMLGQTCDCESTFDWLKTTFEENDAGFQYIIDKKGEQAYNLHNQIYVEKISKIEDPINCEANIRAWLTFFRKGHLEFHYTKKTEAQRNAQNEKEEKLVQADETNEGKSSPTYPLHEKFLSSDTPFAEQVSERMFYLRIPSLEGYQKPLIDSVILANRTKILSTENLIIDIRNGVGGNDSSYEELLPFIYTNPFRTPTVEFLSTPLNNQRMYEMATNTGMALQWELNPTKEEMAEFQRKYDTLSNHLGEFVNLKPSDVSITKFDTIYPFPRNVGIMINDKNVSTDEEFLLDAKQSKKVKLFGTRTKGALDVSNLYLTFSPCEDYVLVYALSKSLRIPNIVIDDIGIMPDYYIDKGIPESEWIDYVISILNE